MFNKFNTVLIYLGFISMSLMYGAAVPEKFHSQGIVSQPVKEICARLGASVETLEQANEFGQKKLLRSGERWDSQADKPLERTMQENKEFLREKLGTLGMIETIIPEGKVHAYALLMGALRPRVTLRLAHLKSLVEKGYQFKYIVLLGGVCPLIESEKSGLPETVTTEAEMMEYEFKHVPELQHISMLLVNAPMIEHADGSRTRPTTDSTLLYFAKIAPTDGSCVVISNNPYTERQKKVAERILDQKRFPVSAAGEKANPDDNIAITLDEFARSLYEEHVRLRKARELQSK